MNPYHIIAEERGNPYAEVEYVGMENASMHICYELHHYLIFRNVMQANPNKSLRMQST